MSRAAQIYPLERMLERELKKIRTDQHNSDCLYRYYQARVADGVSLARINKCLWMLRRISQMLGKPFAGATKDDFVRLVSDFERSNLSDWTKRDYKVILKHFYKWFRNWEDGMPPEVRWIKKTRGAENKRPILPRDLLTPDEKIALIKAAQNPRDRALIEVFSESGRRFGEILTLRIKDIEFDSMGAKLFISGKTGEDFARIISSAPALAVWLDNHPLRDSPESPVWIGLGRSNRMKQLSYVAAKSVLKKIAKRAGMKKRIHFYLFRHTRIDESLGILTEAQQCMMFGWKFGSRMPATYMKRYGKHIDNAQATMNGVKPPQKEATVIQVPKTCTRCNISNSPVSKFCNRCGSVLDVQTALQLDEARKRIDMQLNKITEDPEKLEILRALLRSV